MLWIHAPVFGQGPRPFGLVGTAFNLSDFVESIYQNHKGTADLYLFDAAGEITGANDVGLVKNKAGLGEVLGRTGREILGAAKELSGIDGISCFETEDRRAAVAVASIPAMGWHMAAVHHFTDGESMPVGMTVLFGVIMGVIFFCFAACNLFIVKILEPLNLLVRTVNQAVADWELKPHKEARRNDEIGTLGDFLQMTIIDPLTGLYNRRYMDGQLKNILKSLSRAGGGLSLLMVDIDYFKCYNDTYGHDAGDSCLRAVASTLAQCLKRDEEFIARYGGEEFAVILPNTDEAGARLMADHLLEKVRACDIPNEASGAADKVTISIGGVSGLVDHLRRARDFVRGADQALYEAKKNGRDRCVFEILE
jgi:diguanylate cyclase (GGDEF)-like protein